MQKFIIHLANSCAHTEPILILFLNCYLLAERKYKFAFTRLYHKLSTRVHSELPLNIGELLMVSWQFTHFFLLVCHNFFRVDLKFRTIFLKSIKYFFLFLDDHFPSFTNIDLSLLPPNPRYFLTPFLMNILNTSK